MTPAQIEFYKRLAHSLALQFGPNCEIVVHDLETGDMDHSIVAIENGHVSGRKLGDGPNHIVLESMHEDAAEVHDRAPYLTKTADGKLDAYVGKQVKIGVRPEDMKDDEEFLEKHPSSHIDTEVEVSELMGAEIYLYLTYKGQNLMARVAPTSKSRRGDKVTMAMDTHKIHLFDPETELTLLN